MNPFKTSITITGSRGATAPRVHLSLSAEEMDGSMDEPMGESSVNSAIRRMTYIVKTSDLGGLVPQVGDIVIGADGKRFAVRKVQPFYNREFILDTKSC